MSRWDDNRSRSDERACFSDDMECKSSVQDHKQGALSLRSVRAAARRGPVSSYHIIRRQLVQHRLEHPVRRILCRSHGVGRFCVRTSRLSLPLEGEQSQRKEAKITPGMAEEGDRRERDYDDAADDRVPPPRDREDDRRKSSHFFFLLPSSPAVFFARSPQLPRGLRQAPIAA